MSTGFHPHTHLHSMCRQLAVKLLRFLGVLQLQLPVISRFGIHKRNLLKARVIICSYNDHCPAPFYPSLWLVSTTKSTRAWEPALLWNQFHSLTPRTLARPPVCPHTARRSPARRSPIVATSNVSVAARQGGLLASHRI